MDEAHGKVGLGDMKKMMKKMIKKINEEAVSASLPSFACVGSFMVLLVRDMLSRCACKNSKTVVRDLV